jgi:membrane-bound lytic murein transglycosylase D
VSRNRARKQSTAFSALSLPRETRFYVPKLQAIKNLVRDPEAHQLELPAIRNEPYFAVLRKSRDIDVTTAAQLADMPIDEFRALNPGFNRPVIVGATEPNLLVPADRAEMFVANLAAYEATGQALSSWTARKLAPGETIDAVARDVGLTVEQLREANGIPAQRRLVAGSTVLIPRDETMEDDIAPTQLAGAFSLVPEQAAHRRMTYRVRRGDTLGKVSARYGVPIASIKSWNNLKSTQLFAGQRLNLSVPAHKAGKRTNVAKTRTVRVAKQR